MSAPESQSRAWFVCPSCGGACRELRAGVCPGCHYTLSGGDQAPDDVLAHPSWSARINCAELPETNWWCST